MHRPFRLFMTLYDRLWRACHDLDAVDELICLSFETWQGPPRLLGGRTWLRAGDVVAHLHFNRDCLCDPRLSRQRKPFAFARLLFCSLGHIAERIEAGDPELTRIRMFYGITWFRPHGQRLGFMVERLPDSFLTRLRILHFRLFLYAFFPAQAERHSDLHPHAFWLSREDLLKNFGREAPPRVRTGMTS